MPELPEVETTRRGIEPQLKGATVHDMQLRCRQLRYPVPATLAKKLRLQSLQRVRRRAKYLIFDFDNGGLLVHLGMSGSLRVLPDQRAPEKHDHWDIEFDHGRILRFTDPRRFGMTLWSSRNIDSHRFLKNLGIEPLSEAFDGAYLFERAHERRTSVKAFIMDQRVVVGVGNIYASEALWLAGIHPQRAAGRISRPRFDKLVVAIKKVLAHAIEAGGTSLRDFSGADGEPGYFQLRLRVYDREGQACRRRHCDGNIRRIVITGRSTYYCPRCQR